MIKSALIVFCLGASASALAAQRVIQFGGVAVSIPSQIDVGNMITVTGCFIFIANTGATDQVINSIQFVNYSNLSASATLASPDQEALNDSVTSNGTCTGNTIKPGGICVVLRNNSTLTLSGVVSPCAGRITVSDSNAASPGSVVASGAVTTFQEVRARGGTFSGALYLSGPHLVSSSNMPANNAGSVTITAPQPSGRNTDMNPYCQVSCEMGGNAPSSCLSYCGGWGDGVSGFPSNGTHGPASFFAPVMTATGGNTPKETNTGSGGAPTPSQGSPAYAYAQVYADAHMASGYVQEIAIGPFTAICSGNPAYFTDGGDDFRHSDAIGQHSFNIILGPSWPSGPPERLICNHRHGMQDPYSTESFSSPIVINGGNAF